MNALKTGMTFLPTCAKSYNYFQPNSSNIMGNKFIIFSTEDPKKKPLHNMDFATPQQLADHCKSHGLQYESALYDVTDSDTGIPVSLTEFLSVVKVDGDDIPKDVDMNYFVDIS